MKIVSISTNLIGIIKAIMNGKNNRKLFHGQKPTNVINASNANCVAVKQCTVRCGT